MTSNGEANTLNAPTKRLPAIHPLPISSASETEIHKVFTKRVRSYCTKEIREFAECAKANMFLVNFTCHDQKVAMNTCFKRHGTLDERDRAREEWFANKLQESRATLQTFPSAPVKDNPTSPYNNRQHNKQLNRSDTREGFSQ